MRDLKEMLTRHEGERLAPYRCPAGKLTIGVGWNIDANGLPGDIRAYLDEHGKITPEMSGRLLDMAIETAIQGCEKLFPSLSSFSENRRDALVDWMFNLGYGKASGFVKAVKAINNQDWELAADHLKDSAWYKQVGKRAVEIIKMIKEG